MTQSEGTSGLLLNGLNGGNPLGFLAAVGTLQVVTYADPSFERYLGWRIHGGVWTPFLSGDERLTEKDLIEKLLMPALKRKDSDPAKAFDFADNLNISQDQFRDVAKAAHDTATFQDQRNADFVAAFGCESLATSDKKSIQDTALRTMSGAGHQHFLRTMRELVATTERKHLWSSLFETWRYSDDRPSLRWDPTDDRRHALRWKKPAEDPGKTMRGANRLALEALPLLPTAPREKKLHTTGFSQRRGEGVFFTWPIWESPLGIDIVRSLFSLAELQDPQPNRDRLRAMGIVEIFRCQRITVDKYRNFTSAIPT